MGIDKYLRPADSCTTRNHRQRGQDIERNEVDARREYFQRGAIFDPLYISPFHTELPDYEARPCLGCQLPACDVLNLQSTTQNHAHFAGTLQLLRTSAHFYKLSWCGGLVRNIPHNPNPNPNDIPQRSSSGRDWIEAIVGRRQARATLRSATVPATPEGTLDALYRLVKRARRS